jgi:hypothetical protein
MIERCGMAHYEFYPGKTKQTAAASMTIPPFGMHESSIPMGS